MQLLDGNVEGVWFDRVENALHVTSRESHQVLAAWPGVVAREWDRIERAWSRARRPLRVDFGRPPAFETRRSEQLALEFYTPRRVFGSRGLAAYRDVIPERVVNAITAFSDFHGELLEFAAGGHACVDLLVGNPALVVVLLTAWDFEGVSYVGTLDRAKQLVASGMRQREVLQQVGIPSGEALPRLLRKVPAWCLDLITAAALADALRSPDLLTRLSHLPVITGAVLQVAAKPMLAYVSDRFLRELQTLDLTEARHLASWESPSQRAVDELSAFTELWEQHGPVAPPRVDSIAGLGRQLGDFYVALGRPDFLKGGNVPLPDAPIPGSDDIEPITTRQGLLEESERQRHCVASYVLSIENRRRAVYRVLRPQRATLSLRSRDGAWEIEELRAKANAPVRRATEDAVRAWFIAASSRDTPGEPPRGN